MIWIGKYNPGIRSLIYDSHYVHYFRLPRYGISPMFVSVTPTLVDTILVTLSECFASYQSK